MAERDSDDSDAPEEFTAKQAFEVDEELRKVQKESKTRVARERKERQRLWAQRKTSRPTKCIQGDKLLTEFEPREEEEPQNMEATRNGMLPNDIVSLLAAREKQVFSSDSEEENLKEKLVRRKKKRRNSEPEPVILNEIPHAQCVENALKFLKEKKMQVSRSTSVLENSSQALRLISSSGLLGKK